MTHDRNILARADRKETSRAPESRRAFTLTEMLVVVAIIVLLTLLAIPAIRTLTGTKSIDAAQNTLATLIVRAREEAVGIQEVRGVMFYLDPADDVMKAAIVQSVPPTSANGAAYSLDLVADREYLALPRGIGVQTIVNPTATSGQYLGFSAPAGGAWSYGGVILFDGYGRLIAKTYAFSFKRADGTVTAIGSALGLTGDTSPGTTILSQFGFALFDRESYSNSVNGGPITNDAWLDANSTPILINRYNGTLIRGE